MSVKKRANLQGLFITLTVFASVLAVLPIVAAIVAPLFSASPARTAFAGAPSGEYAVGARAGETSDEIVVVPADNPAGAMAVGTIPHLPGYASRGAVSPSGRQLAAVVADAGTPSRPGASLLVLNLESGALTRLAVGFDVLQTPLWTPDGGAVVASRIAGNGDGRTTVSFAKVSAGNGAEAPLAQFEGVAGAYAIGWDAAGELAAVVIDGRGSTLYYGARTIHLSNAITRDWQIRPGGGAIAFIESDTTGGLTYRARTISFDAPSGDVAGASALSLASPGRQLGIAWRPGAAEPTAGFEPSHGVSGAGVSAQALSLAGFDVPLAYSASGQVLAVQRWSGTGYESAGDVELQFVTESGRQPLGDLTRFFGWASR